MPRCRPDWYYRQSAAVPYRVNGDGSIRVLLVTSRKKKHWILPKGIIERDLTAARSAAREALEEAGVEGRVDERPLGSYLHGKWGGTCTVEVFPLAVERVHGHWLEADSRSRSWMALEDALMVIHPSEARPVVELLRRRVGRAG